MPLFINGRTDVFFREVGPPGARAEEAARRLAAYAAAGADCAFAPGVADPNDIALLVERLPVPLNVMYTPSMPSLSDLRRLGVGRLTFGAWLYVAALATVQEVANELRSGDVNELQRRTRPSREARRAITD